MPLSGLPLAAPEIEIDDVALLLDAGEHHLANQLVLLSEAYSSDLAAAKDFTALKQSLGETMPPNVMLGTVGSALLTQDEILPFMPKIIALSNLIEGLCDGLAKDLDLAVNILEVLGPAFKKILGTNAHYIPTVDNKTRATEFRALFSEFVRPGDFGLRVVDPAT